MLMARAGPSKSASPFPSQAKHKKRDFGQFKGDSESEPAPSSKKAKEEHHSGSRQPQIRSPDTPANGDSSNNMAAGASSANSRQSELPTIPHDARSMSIISSSHIQQTVARALEVLSRDPETAPTGSRVIMLHSKAPVASKMVTIAEIAKREIARAGGKWYQYNKVEQTMVEQKNGPKEASSKAGKDKVSAGGTPRADVAEGEGSESEEDTTAFETMKTPFERANEGKSKVRAVPTMTIYLARDRIDSLRKAYG
jgi:hypothetical protein